MKNQWSPNQVAAAAAAAASAASAAAAAAVDINSLQLLSLQGGGVGGEYYRLYFCLLFPPHNQSITNILPSVVYRHL